MAKLDGAVRKKPVERERQVLSLRDAVGFVTPEQVADILGLTVARVYAAVRSGIIPAVHIGRQIRFDAEALREWVARGGTPLAGGWRKEAR